MGNNPIIRLAKPYFDEDELNEVKSVLDSGYLTQGPKVEKFEQMVADYVGTKHAIATTSATTALHLSLVALGVTQGDEVLVPDFTFPATANVVVQQGAKPVLVDIDLTTFTVNIDDLKRKVTSRTKVIMPVHAFGLSADMNPILELARAKDLKVIEDAACAIGTTYYGKRCGGLGTTGCFSFHPRKVITTGEGGMITTNDEQLAEKMRMLRSHGGKKINAYYQYELAGFNYRLSDVQAAIGIAQMRKLDRLLARKRKLADQYSLMLKDTKEIIVPKELIWGGHIYQSYVIMLYDTIDRDKVIELMKQKNIETTLGTYALHAQPFYSKLYIYKMGELPNSYLAFCQSLTLPLYDQMNEDDLLLVVNVLKEVLPRCRK